MDHYIAAWKRYADFTGRSRRKEYWYFVLINIIVSLVLGLIDGVLGLGAAEGIGLLGGLYSLAVLLPSIAVGVRRLHDTGRSGWWLLLVLIPLVGPIILIVFLASGSQPGTNKYDKDAVMA
jgi:uncharacterized membrane protein YhaH (DUF805 family)